MNRELIALARESRGLTQNELSEVIGIKQGSISKIENGTLDFSQELENLIPEALGYPKKFFYEKCNVIRVEGHYRKKVSLSVKELKKYKAKMTLTEWHINKLSDSINFPVANIPSWDLDTDGSAKDASKYVREYWKIPRGRISDLASIIEDNGILIAPLDLGDMDGLSTYSSEYNIPILYVNKNRSADRIRHTIAHELCHYVCHFGKKIPKTTKGDLNHRDIEQEANDFASEILMPENEIRPHLSNLNLEKLGDLKRYWRVSMQSILMKSRKMNLMTENQSKYLWKQISYMGYKLKEPYDIQPDKISLLKEFFNIYLFDMGYSKIELADFLNLTLQDLDIIYFEATLRPKFKIALSD